MTTRGMPTKERFELQFIPEPMTGCFLWTGSVNGSGYGQFWLGKRRDAHRVAYELYKGPVPDGLELDHLCRVRCCVNPDHLEPVTKKTNCLRGTSFAAQNAKKTHCPRGHAYDARNTTYSGGSRFCRACMSIRSKKYNSRAWKRGRAADGGDHPVQR